MHMTSYSRCLFQISRNSRIGRVREFQRNNHFPYLEFHLERRSQYQEMASVPKSLKRSANFSNRRQRYEKDFGKTIETLKHNFGPYSSVVRKTTTKQSDFL